MGRSSPLHLFAACALTAALAGCKPKDAGIDTASRETSGASIADTSTGSDDMVAITTSSAEARTLYTRGR
jgi:hypothetical protein